MIHAAAALVLMLVPTPGAVPPPAAPPQELPWPVKLGLRVEQVDRSLPLVDQVVLVPDGATYLDELSRWSPRGRWPVLIETKGYHDYVGMFIRRFNPTQVIRRESLGASPADRAAMQAAMERIVTGAWSRDPAVTTPAAAFERSSFTPAGLVVASADDPAWPAAVALAAGRGQPIMWLDEQFRNPDQVLSVEEVTRLAGMIESAAKETGLEYAALGDELEAITLCRAVAGRFTIGKAPGTDKPEIRALTDRLGRHEAGPRWAFTGWIFGDEAHCAYIAMCSLFLPRESAWLVNTYPESPEWTAYGMAEAAATLREKGMEVREAAGTAASERAWLNQLPGGASADVIFINSMGNVDFFEMSQGRCHPVDVPVLNQPAALHLIHSWSLRTPASVETLGATWLDRGVYAMVGSVDEPLLGAFMPPAELAKRCVSFVPFLVAARHFQANTWKIATIGDPLMLCLPPGAAPAHSRTPPEPREGGVNLVEHVKDLVRGAPDDATGRVMGDAIETLAMLGHDEQAVQLWKLARQRELSRHAARPALGPLFRRREVDLFLQAWNELPQRDPLAVDMLWHLLTPRLGAGLGDDWLMVLQANIRRPFVHADLARLAPHLGAAFGEEQARLLIQREMDATDDERVRRALQKLLRPTGRARD